MAIFQIKKIFLRNNWRLVLVLQMENTHQKKYVIIVKI